jgi:hypothetical protein
LTRALLIFYILLILIPLICFCTQKNQLPITQTCNCSVPVMAMSQVCFPLLLCLDDNILTLNTTPLFFHLCPMVDPHEQTDAGLPVKSRAQAPATSSKDQEQIRFKDLHPNHKLSSFTVLLSACRCESFHLIGLFLTSTDLYFPTLDWLRSGSSARLQEYHN